MALRTAALFAAASCAAAASPLTLTIGGTAATLRNYSFPSEAPTVMLGNGLVIFSFGPRGNTIAATSVQMNGTELNSQGEESYYVDSAGGKQDLVCDTIQVLRLEPALIEVAFVDSRSSLLRHSHHLIMVPGTAGIYGFDVMTAVRSTSISEVRCVRWRQGTRSSTARKRVAGDEAVLGRGRRRSALAGTWRCREVSRLREWGVARMRLMRPREPRGIACLSSPSSHSGPPRSTPSHTHTPRSFNTRWDRCIFNQPFNWERKADSQQPTYAFLGTQPKVRRGGGAVPVCGCCS